MNPITLQTITSIELSNDCNMSCLYCVSRLLKRNSVRNVGIMSDEVFDRACDLIAILCQRGTQQEVSLHNLGEPLLDPQFLHRAGRVKRILGPTRPLYVCTNGLNMTPELARGLAMCGVDQVDISAHSAYHARRALDMLLSANAPVGVVNGGAMTGAHNFAGQIEPEHSVTVRVRPDCTSLPNGRGYVGKEGFMTACCYDYRNLGAFGTVFHDDIFERPIWESPLCAQCHQPIPEGTRARLRAARASIEGRV